MNGECLHKPKGVPNTLVVLLRLSCSNSDNSYLSLCPNQTQAKEIIMIPAAERSLDDSGLSVRASRTLHRTTKTPHWKRSARTSGSAFLGKSTVQTGRPKSLSSVGESTACLGRLFQWLIVLMAKNFLCGENTALHSSWTRTQNSQLQDSRMPRGFRVFSIA